MLPIRFHINMPLDKFSISTNIYAFSTFSMSQKYTITWHNILQNPL